jgi:hypothetical protein
MGNISYQVRKIGLRIDSLRYLRLSSYSELGASESEIYLLYYMGVGLILFAIADASRASFKLWRSNSILIRPFSMCSRQRRSFCSSALAISWVSNALVA